MSFQAYLNGVRIDRDVHQLDEGIVTAIREQVRRGGELLHPFCEHRVLITYRKAWRDAPRQYHFAHYPGTAGECEWAGESDQHIAVKDALVCAIRACGWEARAEAGKSGAGRPDHIPDVLATRPSTGERVVFEVQLSVQRLEIYKERQRRRTAVAKTTSVWLVIDPNIVRAYAGQVPVYLLTRTLDAIADPDNRDAEPEPLGEWVGRVLRREVSVLRSDQSWASQPAIDRDRLRAMDATLIAAWRQAGGDSIVKRWR